jgi:hypothetical protein
MSDVVSPSLRRQLLEQSHVTAVVWVAHSDSVAFSASAAQCDEAHRLAHVSPCFNIS